MSFPLIYLLVPYFIFLGVWFILSLVALYHVIRFGGKIIGSMFLAVIYISGAIVLSVISYTYLNEIDWRSQASFLNSPGALPSFEIPY